MAPTFDGHEMTFLRGQRLGRLATVDRKGAPQNNPVGFVLDEATGQILIGGRALATTRKFRNLARNHHVAFVVDELASVDPWQVRGVEIRGRAEALQDAEPPMRGMGREVIRITPDWIASWGVIVGTEGMTVRT
ncbi:MAG: PPOX class F420-dependent oxidoreductase [Mycobacteriales bacterium]